MSPTVLSSYHPRARPRCQRDVFRRTCLLASLDALRDGWSVLEEDQTSSMSRFKQNPEAQKQLSRTVKTSTEPMLRFSTTRAES
jgi:hypothetical protein